MERMTSTGASSAEGLSSGLGLLRQTCERLDRLDSDLAIGALPGQLLQQSSSLASSSIQQPWGPFRLHEATSSETKFRRILLIT